jgi:hypothetical protein
MRAGTSIGPVAVVPGHHRHDIRRNLTRSVYFLFQCLLLCPGGAEELRAGKHDDRPQYSLPHLVPSGHPGGASFILISEAETPARTSNRSIPLGRDS